MRRFEQNLKETRFLRNIDSRIKIFTRKDSKTVEKDKEGTKDEELLIFERNIAHVQIRSIIQRSEKGKWRWTRGERRFSWNGYRIQNLSNIDVSKRLVEIINRAYKRERKKKKSEKWKEEESWELKKKWKRVKKQ